MSKRHWREDADLVTGGDPRILGEDENGYLFVPSKTRREYWDRLFNPRNPTHWVYYLRSRLTNRIAMIEHLGGEG
jgi:hypothetical protein